jgi:hypothetical protein
VAASGGQDILHTGPVPVDGRACSSS